MKSLDIFNSGLQLCKLWAAESVEMVRIFQVVDVCDLQLQEEIEDSRIL